MNIQQSVQLQHYNSFKIVCEAKYFTSVETELEFLELMQTDIFKDNSHLILGWWSNVLLTQDEYPGLVIKNDILGKEIVSEDDTTVTIKVGWWEDWNEFVLRSVKQWYYGCENLVSIPGTVWAAPMQNIWAYGVEVKDLILNVEWVDLPSGAHIILDNYECDFDYRDSVFKQWLKGKFFITHATFRLNKYSPQTYFPQLSYGAVTNKISEMCGDMLDCKLTPTLVADAIAQIRASKLPDWKQIGTAWSFFKNPVIPRDIYKQLKKKFPELKGYSLNNGFFKLSAGQLIDATGLKGLTQGNVGTYENHALVIVNHWGGTGKDIQDLATHIQNQVVEKFGIMLQPEVNYV